jgi:hypothetical protein
VILCRSADRRDKERAMHHRFSRRIAGALDRLTARIVRSKKRLDRCRSTGKSAASCRTSGRRLVLLSHSIQTVARQAFIFHLQVAHHIAFDDWARLSEGAPNPTQAKM